MKKGHFMIFIIFVIFILIAILLAIFLNKSSFQAKIGEELIFDKNDIVSVCTSSECSGVNACWQEQTNEFKCYYSFIVIISPKAAERYSKVTSKLDVIDTKGNSYISEDLIFYENNKIIGQMKLNADIKGKAITQLPISGIGNGESQESAYNDAINKMKNYWNILA